MNNKFKELYIALLFIFVSSFLFYASGFISVKIKDFYAFASTVTWPFTTAGNYTYDNTKINVSGGFANLIAKDQTDDDNDATGGFAAGSHSDTEWDAGSSWLELDAAGLTAGSGNYTSRIMDAGGDVTWTTIDWRTALPNYKELPNTGAIETAYSSGNADMSGNILLMHMNEAAGAIIDSSGNVNNGVNNGATYGASGMFFEALNFDGVDDNVSVADANSLDVSTEFTAEAWVKFNSVFDNTATSNMGLLDKVDYQLFFDKTDGKLKFNLDSATSTWSLVLNGTNNKVTDMAVYNNILYATMGSSVAGGNNIYAFDGVSWTLSYDGVGTPTSFITLAVYNGKLYAGQGGVAGAADVYVFDGTTWSLSLDGPGTNLSDLEVYNGKLYAAHGSSGTYGDVYEFDGTSWSMSYDGPSLGIFSLAVYNGKLYAGRGNGAAGNDDLMEFDGTTWSVAYNGWTSLNVMALKVFDGKLYAGLGTANGVGDIWVYDGATWSISYDGAGKAVLALEVFNNKLYAGIYGNAGAGDVLLFNGTTWDVAYDGAQESIEALAVFRGRLYAGQGNGVGDADAFRFGNTVSASPASWDTDWHHIAATYTGLRMNIYIDGVWNATTVDTSFLIASSSNPLLIGQTYDTSAFDGGINEFFGGSIDEFAIYNRALSYTEIKDHYKRGAVRLKYQVRSCDDAVCAGESFIGPDGTAGTFYSELANPAIGLPSLALTNVGNNRYFQYKAFFETDNPTYWPALRNITIGPTHYDAGIPTIVNTTGQTYDTLTGFAETLGGANVGTINYQLSNDGAS